MIDKNYCMSSYMAFRYIEDDNKDFCAGGVLTEISNLYQIRKGSL